MLRTPEQSQRDIERIANLGEMLHTQYDLLQNVINCLPWGVAFVDTQYKFRIWNQAATEIAGVGATDAPPEEWASVYNVTDEATGEPVAKNDMPVVRTLQNNEIVEDWRCYVGNKLIEVSSAPASGGALVVFKQACPDCPLNLHGRLARG